MLRAKCHWIKSPAVSHASHPVWPLDERVLTGLPSFPGSPCNVQEKPSGTALHAPVPTDQTVKQAPGRLPSARSLPTPQLSRGKGHTISGCPGPQGPAALPQQPHPLPAAEPRPQQDQVRCTHRLTVPSGGAVLPWWAWGSLRPRDKSCIGAPHRRACGVLGGEGAGGGHRHTCLDAQQGVLQHPGLGSAPRRDMQVDTWGCTGWAHMRVLSGHLLSPPAGCSALARTPQARPPRARHKGRRGGA